MVVVKVGDLNKQIFSTKEGGYMEAVNLTDRFRKIMALANQEAQRFNRENVDTEHMLLGLVKEGSGVAANVLKNLDVDLRRVRLEVEKLIKPGPDMVTMGKLPRTPAANKVADFAIEEAGKLGHNYVGSEHLLLGLLRAQDPATIANQVLNNLQVDPEQARKETLFILHGKEPPPQTKKQYVYFVSWSTFGEVSWEPRSREVNLEKLVTSLQEIAEAINPKKDSWNRVVHNFKFLREEDVPVG